MMIRIAFFVFFVQVLFIKFGYAQGFMRPGGSQIIQESQSVSANNDNSIWKLPPLQTLIDLALEHSPMVKLADTDIQMGEYELKDIYRDWMRRVSFMADARYGTMFDYSRLVTAPGVANTPTIMMNYGAGAAASMALSDIFDRKRTKQKARMRIDQARMNREEVISGLTQLIITSYYSVLADQKTLALSNELNLTAGLVHDKAKMDFSQNRISLDDYSRANEAYLTAQNEVELQKLNLMKSVSMLEVIVGVALAKIN